MKQVKLLWLLIPIFLLFHGCEKDDFNEHKSHESSSEIFDNEDSLNDEFADQIIEFESANNTLWYEVYSEYLFQNYNFKSYRSNDDIFLREAFTEISITEEYHIYLAPFYKRGKKKIDRIEITWFEDGKIKTKKIKRDKLDDFHYMNKKFGINNLEGFQDFFEQILSQLRDEFVLPECYEVYFNCWDPSVIYCIYPIPCTNPLDGYNGSGGITVDYSNEDWAIHFPDHDSEDTDLIFLPTLEEINEMYVNACDDFVTEKGLSFSGEEFFEIIGPECIDLVNSGGTIDEPCAANKFGIDNFDAVVLDIYYPCSEIVFSIPQFPQNERIVHFDMISYLNTLLCIPSIKESEGILQNLKLGPQIEARFPNYLFSGVYGYSNQQTNLAEHITEAHNYAWNLLKSNISCNNAVSNVETYRQHVLSYLNDDIFKVDRWGSAGEVIEFTRGYQTTVSGYYPVELWPTLWDSTNCD